MLDLKQINDYVVAPTLEYLEMNSLAARQLMIGTGLVESGFRYIHQIGGPALGFWQVEPTTYIGNYNNYLYYRSELLEKVKHLKGDNMSGAEHMITNLKYNCAHARIKYWRDKQPLPKAGDSKGLAEYHKRVYNSPLGDTDVNKSVEFFKKAVEITL